jgi:hypothetical protein
MPIQPSLCAFIFADAITNFSVVETCSNGDEIRVTIMGDD